MTNRLENLPSWKEFEDNAKENNSYLELRIHLDNIRKVIKDKPSLDEINSAKKFYDSLTSLKSAYETNKTQTIEEIRKQLWNLSDEYEIYQETQLLIDWLKPKDNQIEVDNSKVEFDWFFKEAKSETILSAKKIISDLVNKSEILRKLSEDKKDKIKIWLVSKIINSWVVDTLIKWLWKKVEWYDKLVTDKNPIDAISNSLESDKKDITKKDWPSALLESLFNNEIKALEQFIEKNKTHPVFDKFFSNSKNIESLKSDTNLDNFAFAEIKDEKTAFDVVKKKILEYDKVFAWLEQTKEKIFDAVANLPNFVWNMIVKFITALCSMEFIWDFVKSFLWIKSNGEENIRNEVQLEFESRKSINILKTFWLQKWPKWESIESKNDPAIKLLKNKDLSKLDNEKLKVVLARAKEVKVDITQGRFWYNLFEKNIIGPSIKDGEGKIKDSIGSVTPENIINEKDFKDNIPWDSFYTKLESIFPKKLEEKKVETPENKQPENTDKNIQYKDLLIWTIISNELVMKLKWLTLANFTNPQEEEFKKQIISIIWQDEKTLTVMLQYRESIQNLNKNWKLEEFQKICTEDKRDKESGEITFLDISHKRYFLVSTLTWVTPNFYDWSVVVPVQKEEKPVAAGENKTEVAQGDLLPKQVKLCNNSTLDVDWKNYGISVFHNTYNTSVELEDIQYNQTEGVLNLTWKIWVFKNTKQLNKYAVAELYSKIKPLKAGWPSFENNYDWVKVTIRALA